MILLFKNAIKNFLKNKIEIIILIVLSFFTVFIFIGIFGFVSYQKNQSNYLNNVGKRADIILSYESIKGVNSNSSFFFGTPNYQADGTEKQKFQWAESTGFSNVFEKIMSSLLYMSLGNGLPNGKQFNFKINMTDDRIMQDNNTLIKIVPWESFIQNSPGAISEKKYKYKLEKNATNVGNFNKNGNYSFYWSDEYQSLNTYYDATPSNAPILYNNAMTPNGKLINIKNWSNMNSKYTPQYLTNNFPFYDYFKQVNSPVLIAGKVPTNVNEIDINPEYARKHNIDFKNPEKNKMLINSVEYTVVGYATSPKYLYPIFSPVNLSPNAANQCTVFTQLDFYTNIFESRFDTNDISREISIQIQISNKNKQYAINLFHNWFNKYKNSSSILSNLNFNSISKNSNYVYINRYFFNIKLSDFILYLGIVVIIIFVLISVFVIIIITIQQINSDSKKIGILKALGYKNLSIISFYLLIPLTANVIGIILGVICGIVFWGLEILIFSNYFNFATINSFSSSNYLQIFSSMWYFILCSVIFPIIFIFSLSFVFLNKYLGNNITSLIYKAH